MDCMKLIEEVKKRRPLWDTGSREHGGIRSKTSRDVTAQLWEEVAEEMGESKPDVMRKWKSLRDNFRQELKKIQESTEDSSDTGKRRKWVYLSQLSFLTDVMSPVTTTTGSSSNSKKYKVSVDCVTAEPDIDPLEQQDEEVDFEWSVIEKNSQSAKIIKRKAVDEPYIHIERETMENGDYNFLVSFLPIMKQMSTVQKLTFRTRVSQLALDILSDSVNDC